MPQRHDIGCKHEVNTQFIGTTEPINLPQRELLSRWLHPVEN
jgi:hypothetical protein